jgi:hypothetical protein
MTTTETKYVLRLGRSRFPVASLEEASQIVTEFRDAGNYRMSDMPASAVFEDGKRIGYVSYNGRIWPGTPQTWTPDVRPLFTPRAA